MKTIYAALCIGLSFSAFAHKDWEKSVSDAKIEEVRVIGIKTGDTVTVRTGRSCLIGSNCIEGKHQFDVRLPHIAAPHGRQPMARESYLSLKELLLHRDVLFVPFSKNGDVVIGDFIVCQMSIGLNIDLDAPCPAPELLDTDVVKNQSGLIYVYRDGDRFYHSIKIDKADYPEIEAYYQTHPLNNVSTSQHEQPLFIKRLEQHATARVTMAFASLNQSYEGMVYVDPKYTSFDSILFLAQDQAKMLKKGVWSLPVSQQQAPWLKTND
jgi:hypothetical protein